MAGVLVVVAGLVATWLVLGADRARETTEDEARQRLDAGSVVTTGSTAGTGTVLSGAPPQGVYRYRGSGHETTSFPPASEEQGPAMPATVTIQPDGCWVLRIDYNTHHWQDWRRCTTGGRLTEQGGSTYTRRAIGTLDVENTSTFTCDPVVVVSDASDETGTVRHRSCVGAGSLLPDQTTASGTTTNLGRETLDIGGTPVDTIHVRDDLTYAGAQTGTERADFWYDVTSGLPVRNEHHVVAVTGTPFGAITFTEDSRFELETLHAV